MVRSSTNADANQVLRSLAELVTADLSRIDAGTPRDDLFESLRGRLRDLQASFARSFEREHDHWSHLRSGELATQRWIRLQIDQHNELIARLAAVEAELARCAGDPSISTLALAAEARAIRALALHQLSEERLFQRSVLDESYAD